MSKRKQEDDQNVTSKNDAKKQKVASFKERAEEVLANEKAWLKFDSSVLKNEHEWQTFYEDTLQGLLKDKQDIIDAIKKASCKFSFDDLANVIKISLTPEFTKPRSVELFSGNWPEVDDAAIKKKFKKATVPLGCCKTGGFPHVAESQMEAAAEKFEGNGRFAGQLNLKELTEKFVFARGLLPESGMLYFFGDESDGTIVFLDAAADGEKYKIYSFPEAEDMGEVCMVHEDENQVVKFTAKAVLPPYGSSDLFGDNEDMIYGFDVLLDNASDAVFSSHALMFGHICGQQGEVVGKNEIVLFHLKNPNLADVTMCWILTMQDLKDKNWDKANCISSLT